MLELKWVIEKGTYLAVVPARFADKVGLVLSFSRSTYGMAKDAVMSLSTRTGPSRIS